MGACGGERTDGAATPGGDARSEGEVTIGKANQINNFCIGAQGNENKCMACHAGYAWEQGREAQLA